MKKILIFIGITFSLLGYSQFPAPDSVYNDQGKIRYLEAGDTATKFQSTFNTLVAYANDTLATIDSVRTLIDSLANNLNETDPVYSASVASEIDENDTTRWGSGLTESEIEAADFSSLSPDTTKTNVIEGKDNDTVRIEGVGLYNGVEIGTVGADSSWNTININSLQSKDSDTTIVDANLELNEGIKLRVDTISFSVSMTFDFKGKATTQVINMTNNASLAIDMPIGSFYEVEVYQDGTGGRTLTVTGATQASTSEDQDETADAVSLYQFRKYADGNIYYWIANR